MLELSLAELAFISLIALIFIGPQELPEVLRSALRFVNGAKRMVAEVKGSVNELVDESGISEVKRAIEQEAKYIEDLDGNMQRIYDVSDLPGKQADKNEGET